MLIELFKFVCFMTLMLGGAVVMTWGDDKRKTVCKECGSRV